MTKHRKCSVCNGNRKVLREVYDPRYMRMRQIEEKCSNCNGTGFEEKKEEQGDDGCIIHGQES